VVTVIVLSCGVDTDVGSLVPNSQLSMTGQTIWSYNFMALNSL